MNSLFIGGYVVTAALRAMIPLLLGTSVVVAIIMAAMPTASSTQFKAEQIVVGKIQNRATADKNESKQLECLANNIYYEARGEPEHGMLAVAMVTLNRTASEKFPDNICEVVHQKKRANGKTVCQFSWVCEGHDTSKKNKRLYEQCLKVARASILNYDSYVNKVVAGAMFYHADYVKPRWAHGVKPVKRIGRHIFYNKVRMRA